MAEMMNPEQAMMQGAMGSALAQAGEGLEPSGDITNTGNSTPEEQAGRGGDTILAHLTPGEFVVPEEIVSDSVNRRKLESLFEDYDLDFNEFQVGNEMNKINPETGYPEFFVHKKVKRAVKKVTRGIKKAVKKVTGEVKGFISSVERRARHATWGREKYLTNKMIRHAQAEHAAAKAMYDKQYQDRLAAMERQREEVKAKMLFEARRNRGQLVTLQSKFDEKLSAWAKQDAELGPAGVVAETAELSEEAMSSVRAPRKKSKRKAVPTPARRPAEESGLKTKPERRPE